MSANADQIAYWNGPRGEQWVAAQELLDGQLRPFGEAALAAARVEAGETVVEVGCGCGAMTLALATQVGKHGAVLAVDVSRPMLARARERAAGLRQARFELADASSFAFPGGANCVFSRFGVMFFDDPRAAFANLARALRPGGRIAFVCWRSLAENPWMAVPLAAARGVLASPPPAPPPDAPGPLSFADPSRVRAVLENGGFREVALAPFDVQMEMAGGGGLDAATQRAVDIGPAARLLLEADEPTRARATAAVRAALAPHARGNEVRLGAAAWIVTARR